MDGGSKKRIHGRKNGMGIRGYAYGDVNGGSVDRLQAQRMLLHRHIHS